MPPSFPFLMLLRGLVPLPDRQDRGEEGALLWFIAPPRSPHLMGVTPSKSVREGLPFCARFRTDVSTMGVSNGANEFLPTHVAKEASFVFSTPFACLFNYMAQTSPFTHKNALPSYTIVTVGKTMDGPLGRRQNDADCD